MRWSVSYRVRAMVLVALLTSAAIALTAWVSARSTVAQLSDSVDSQQQDVDVIAAQLRDYGVVHGVWVGVSDLTLELELQTSQRIKLTTQNGEVIVDTDHLHGRTARATSSRSPVAIVPRPDLNLTGLSWQAALTATLDSITAYRSDVRMAACLTQAGVMVTSSPGQYGIGRIRYDATQAQLSGCAVQPATLLERKGDIKEVNACWMVYKGAPPSRSGAPVTSTSVDRCLTNVFQERTVDDDAVTLLLFTGFRGSPSLHVDSRRILIASIPILLIAIACAALLSRQVLRPVDAVIRASRRLEVGHRTARVPERGHDEMTALAYAFNRMADAVQAGEDQQRQMAADIAHELRTPLANIRGYLEALKDGVLEPTAEVFESLHEEALLQQRTIDDLQDLALADRHRLIDHRIRVDVGELVRTARAAHAARAEALDVTLVADSETGLSVDGDPDRLRQAIGNLITNALRATSAGGHIVVSAKPHKPDQVSIVVSDTGHGIAPEHLPHIFDRFWRADPSRARDTGGSGLGLAITKEIIAGHGGTISATSAPGAGAAFTIILPAAE